MFLNNFRNLRAKKIVVHLKNSIKLWQLKSFTNCNIVEDKKEKISFWKYLPANRLVSIETGLLDIRSLFASSCWVIFMTFWLNWALLRTGSTAGIPMSRVTGVFLEIVEFFLVKMCIKLWKLSKLSKKVKIYAIKFNLLDFY